MATVVIHDGGVVESSPALPLIYEGLSEIVQEGWQTWRGIEPPVSPTDSTIYAVSASDSDVVGVLCFAWDTAHCIADVTLAYVEPSSRREGVFRQMWDALLYHVHKKQFTVSIGGVHPDNRVALDVFQKLKCRPRALVLEHKRAG